jgi:hypothetical protein
LSDKPEQQLPQAPAPDNARHSANQLRLIKLIRVAIAQAQSEGEWDAANDLLAILKTLTLSANVIVASIATLHAGLT